MCNARTEFHLLSPHTSRASTEAIKMSLQQVEIELQRFHIYCKQNGLTQEQIASICSPLLAKQNKKRLLIYLAIAVCMLCVVYALLHVELVAWHLTAIARIAMVKALPYYDWQQLKGEKCLVKGFSKKTSEKLDCYFCEATDGVEYSDATNAEQLKTSYLDLHLPVIFEYDLYNATIIADDSFGSSLPCNVASNLPYKRATARELIAKTEEYPRYFLHFQNCEFPAVKSLRKMYPRPPFFTAEVSPVQYSWIIASRNYNSEKFKRVNLKDQLTAFVQIKGGNAIRLQPLRDCQLDCVPLEVSIKEGEVLMLTSLWDLEYKPEKDGDNFAVILEAH